MLKLLTREINTLLYTLLLPHLRSSITITTGKSVWTCLVPLIKVLMIMDGLFLLATRWLCLSLLTLRLACSLLLNGTKNPTLLIARKLTDKLLNMVGLSSTSVVLTPRKIS